MGARLSTRAAQSSAPIVDGASMRIETRISMGLVGRAWYVATRFVGGWPELQDARADAEA